MKFFFGNCRNDLDVPTSRCCLTCAHTAAQCRHCVFTTLHRTMYAQIVHFLFYRRSARRDKRPKTHVKRCEPIEPRLIPPKTAQLQPCCVSSMSERVKIRKPFASRLVSFHSAYLTQPPDLQEDCSRVRRTLRS
jgi:hypothetical protein